MGTEREPVLDGEGMPLRLEQPGYYRGFSTMRQKGYWDATTREVVEARVKKNILANQQAGDPAERLKFFVEEGDARLMRAVCERVLPQEDRLPERRIDVLAGVDERLGQGKIEGYRFEDMPPDGEAYRIAVRAFRLMAEELHGKPFAEPDPLDVEVKARDAELALQRRSFAFGAIENQAVEIRQLLLGLGRSVLEREVNIVGHHGC